MGVGAPHIAPARRGGRPRDVDLREVLNAIFYVLATGCQWQALPKDLPPKSTAHHYFMLWEWDATSVHAIGAKYRRFRAYPNSDLSGPDPKGSARLTPLVFGSVE